MSTQASAPTRAEIATELLARKNALASLSAFREYLAPSGLADVSFLPAAHHKLIISRLESAIRDGGENQLLVLPPGSAKSLYTSVLAALWAAARRPGTRILCVSSTATISGEFAHRRRTLAQTPEFKRLGCEPISESLENLMFSNGSSIRAMGASAAISGLRADLLVLDDLVATAEDAASPSILEKLWNWYTRELRTRLTPGGRIIAVGTRWSVNDVLGRIIEENDKAASPFQILHLPLVCVDAANDALGRKAGDVLWPEWFTESFVKTAQSDPGTFTVLYQGMPRDAEGIWVTADKLKIVARAPQHGTKLAAFDLALSEPGKGDRSVCVAALLAPDRTVYITDIQMRQSAKPDVIAHWLAHFASSHDALQTYVDDDNATRMFSAMLAEIARTDQLKHTHLQLLPTGGRSKEVRAAALSGLLNANRIKFVAGDWNSECFAELLAFPGGRHDDRVDCLSLIARAVQKLSSHTPALTEEQRPEGLFHDKNGNLFLGVDFNNLFEDRERARRRRGY